MRKLVLAVLAIALAFGVTSVPGSRAITNEMGGSWSGSFTRTLAGATTGDAQLTMSGYKTNNAQAAQTGTCQLAGGSITCTGTGTLFDSTNPTLLSLGHTFSYQNRQAGIEKSAAGDWRLQVDHGPATLFCAGTAVVTMRAAATTYSPATGTCVIVS